MLTDRNFTPRLGQGELPNISEYASLTGKHFRDAVSLWDTTLPLYKDVLYASVLGEREQSILPAYDVIERGDWRILLNSQRYRNRNTGEIIFRKKYLELRDTFTDAMHVPITNLADRLVERDINLHEWVRQMAVLGRNAHLAAFMFGSGGYNTITYSDVFDLEATLRTQYDYLFNLAEEVLAGNRGERQNPTEVARVITYRGLLNRGVMFIESITRSFERARATLYGFHPDELPNYPADGTMECLVRCRCHWRFRFLSDVGYYHAFWELRGFHPDGRNCATCLLYNRQYYPYTVVRF